MRRDSRLEGPFRDGEAVSQPHINIRDTTQAAEGRDSRIVASALAIRERAADDVAVDAVREGGLERHRPVRRVVVDRDEPGGACYVRG